MLVETIPILATTPGCQYTVEVCRFGNPDLGPKAYIQAAMHADEVPAILVAQQLRLALLELERQGQLLGQVVLVPYANPIGLAQQVLGQHQGRFDLRDGANFNRGYAELGERVGDDLRAELTQDLRHNTRVLRRVLREQAGNLAYNTPTQHLKVRLLQMAIDADVVLDLHCDAEAQMHVYALSPQRDTASALGALLGATAVLLATESGDSPFDEACSRPWLQLQQRFVGFPIELACFGATIELRGEADTDHQLAVADAQAILNFLRHQGVLAGGAPVLPTALCEPTPLAGSEPITAPSAGVVVFRCVVGQRVHAGDPIADLVDAGTGAITTLCCQSDGVVYARCGSRWAHPGKRLAKIAGSSLVRTGKLLSP
jgi:uncharacterized protein